VVGANLHQNPSDSDLVLTTAGISVGEEDHVRGALATLGGNLAVLKVAMKPGKPLAAGRIGEACFLGLPGNPQAALAGAIGFVRPLLHQLAGSVPPAPVLVRADFAMQRKPGRAEFILVELVQRETCFWAKRRGSGGSGRIALLLTASGLAFVPDEHGDVHHGDRLPVHAFRFRNGAAQA
jgi:molybdopterin molybdotransferase